MKPAVDEKFSFLWWGCAAVEISISDLNLVIDPYIKPEKPKYDYIFCTQEHFDHYHKDTLVKLCKGNVFKKLIVNVGCVSPAAVYEDDLAIWNWGPPSFVPKEKLQVLYPKYRKDEAKVFPGPFDMKLGRLVVEGVESGETPSPDIPSLGYLITDTISGLSFYHTGDIWESYPAMEKLKGKVDFLFHMKAGWDRRLNILRRMIEYVHPKYLIPIHYRPEDTQLYPIPRNYTFDEKDDTRFKKGWVPDLDDPAAYVEEIRDAVGNLTRVVNITAGKRYEIEAPSKKIRWKWRFLSVKELEGI